MYLPKMNEYLEKEGGCHKSFMNKRDHNRIAILANGYEITKHHASLYIEQNRKMKRAVNRTSLWQSFHRVFIFLTTSDMTQVIRFSRLWRDFNNYTIYARMILTESYHGKIENAVIYVRKVSTCSLKGSTHLFNYQTQHIFSQFVIRNKFVYVVWGFNKNLCQYLPSNYSGDCVNCKVGLISGKPRFGVPHTAMRAVSLN